MVSQKTQNPSVHLPILQEALFRYPHLNIKDDIQTIYEKNAYVLGFPKKHTRIFEGLARPNTCAIVGIALGDEGKGRLIDNKIESLLKKPGVKKVAVIRFQGGNNAGHTIEHKGYKLDLHLLPSSVLHKEAFGIMDRGELINVSDLQTEVEYVEEIVRSLQNRLFLSEEAILNTDLERAEEVLNRQKTDQSKGGTSRGVGPSYAHHYDRLGLKVYDLLNENWKSTLGDYYNRYQKEFAAFDTKLQSVEVPDFYHSHKQKKAVNRTVGTKKEFLLRLEAARNWLIQRNIAANTFLTYQIIYQDASCAIVFEGAQAAGLDSWTGTQPDVTASNTTIYGIREGTGFWRTQDIKERIGIFKVPYTSSVGARRMPTHIDLPKDIILIRQLAEKDLTSDQKWAAWVRETAHEYGTTTGRPRDINFLDLEFIRYNCRISGIEVLIGTHLDIAQKDQKIKVCTHYENKQGNVIPYQPGLRYQESVLPKYVELPGWDGKECQKAKSIHDLPKNALQFLAFIQTRTGYPIVAVTTGYKREDFITFEGYL